MAKTTVNLRGSRTVVRMAHATISTWDKILKRGYARMDDSIGIFLPITRYSEIRYRDGRFLSATPLDPSKREKCRPVRDDSIIVCLNELDEILHWKIAPAGATHIRFVDDTFTDTYRVYPLSGRENDNTEPLIEGTIEECMQASEDLKNGGRKYVIKTFLAGKWIPTDCRNTDALTPAAMAS